MPVTLKCFSAGAPGHGAMQSGIGSSPSGEPHTDLEAEEERPSEDLPGLLPHSRLGPSQLAPKAARQTHLKTASWPSSSFQQAGVHWRQVTSQRESRICLSGMYTQTPLHSGRARPPHPTPNNMVRWALLDVTDIKFTGNENDFQEGTESHKRRSWVPKLGTGWFEMGCTPPLPPSAATPFK